MVINNELRVSPNIRTHGRLAGHHVFHYGIRKPFRLGAQDTDVSRSNSRHWILLLPEEQDVIGESEFDGERDQLGAMRWFSLTRPVLSDDHQIRVRESRHNLSQCLHRVCNTLQGSEIRHNYDKLCIGWQPKTRPQIRPLRTRLSHQGVVDNMHLLWSEALGSYYCMSNRFTICNYRGHKWRIEAQ